MKNIYILILIMLIVNSVRGQNDQLNLKTTDVVIQGKLVDSATSLQFEKPRNLTLYISKYPFDFRFLNNIKVDEYTAELKYNESFKFIIQPPADRFYMYIAFAPEDGFNRWSGLDNSYLLEKGDSITCRLSDKFFEFWGKGSDKLICQNKIYSLQYQYSKEDYKLAQQNRYESFVEITNKKMDSCFNLQKQIIKNYTKILGKETSQIMLANCYGLRYYQWISFFHVTFGDAIPYLAFFKSTAFKNIDFTLNIKLDHKILEQSYIYSSFLFSKILFENNIYENGILQSTKSEKYLERVFEAIQNSYDGILRDKLMAMFIIKYSQVPSILNYLDKALMLSQSDIYREIFLYTKSIRTKGLPFFNFSLEDIDGKIVRLADLNDKIVIVDFWFNGCENCINLKKAMEPVVSKYKNNPRIAFVSINIDKDKSTWIKGIQSGEYTDLNNINLFTAGLGAMHPLIKYYSIRLYPTLYILTNGKIYNTAPPIPILNKMGKATEMGETKKFIDEIESALKQFPVEQI